MDPKITYIKWLEAQEKKNKKSNAKPIGTAKGKDKMKPIGTAKGKAKITPLKKKKK